MEETVSFAHIEFLYVLELVYHDVFFYLQFEKSAVLRFYELFQIEVLFEIDIEKLLSFMSSDLLSLSKYCYSDSICKVSHLVCPGVNDHCNSAWASRFAYFLVARVVANKSFFKSDVAA